MITKIIEQIERYSLVTLITLYSVFTLTNSSSPSTFSKLLLLTFFATLSVIFWAFREYFKNTLSYAKGKYDLAVLFLALSFIASTVVKSPNKMESFVIPGVTTFVILSAVIYFIINQSGKIGKILSTYAFLASGVLLSVSIILTQIGLFAKIPQLPALIKDVNFNPLGGSIPSIIYLVVVCVLGVALFLKEKEFIKKAIHATLLGVLIMGLVIVSINTLPGKQQSPRFPSAQTSWEIAVDSLKISPIFGVGPGNYLTAFNLFRPVTYNQTDLWQVRFTTANNFYLTLITEVGFAGLLALLILLISIYKNLKETNFSEIEGLSVAIFMVFLAIFPASPVLIFPLFVLLALNSKSENRKYEIQIPTKVPSAIVGSFFVALMMVFDYYAVTYILAENSYKKALDSLSKNDAAATYQAMQKAVNQNPYVDRYHASLAQINMAIASSLASKTDISEKDRETITQLVQGAIAEGKNTVTLNPQRAGNWEILAQIYRSIMPFAQGADQFAIQTYTQAVALDPTNPNLRISLGGVYYALKQYDLAIDSFKLAVLAKPDLANAHYNLAIAYREKKDYDNAISSINAVLGLTAKDSQDYILAQNTLDELKKNKPAGSTENLVAPTNLEKSNIKPPIELPTDSTPPQGQ